MNAALPAALQRLRHPAVRDLAFLLYSPAPWTAPSVLPLDRLQGPAAPRLLARFDADPAPLLAWLTARPTRRLGHYAEALLGYWFAHAPHCQLAAANVQLRGEHGPTLGEFDFLLRLDGEPWHVELACKFYLQWEDGRLLGTDPRDAWQRKADKLAAQLALARRPEAAAVLPEGFDAARSAARVCGWWFSRDGRPPAEAAPGALCGWWRRVDEAWPARPGARWCVLPRLSWLAPAMAQDAAVLEEGALRAALRSTHGPALLAELCREEGEWRECARGFVVPEDWPPTPQRPGEGISSSGVWREVAVCRQTCPPEWMQPEISSFSACGCSSWMCL